MSPQLSICNLDADTRKRDNLDTDMRKRGQRAKKDSKVIPPYLRSRRSKSMRRRGDLVREVTDDVTNGYIHLPLLGVKKNILYNAILFYFTCMDSMC